MASLQLFAPIGIHLGQASRSGTRVWLEGDETPSKRLERRWTDLERALVAIGFVSGMPARPIRFQSAGAAADKASVAVLRLTVGPSHRLR